MRSQDAPPRVFISAKSEDYDYAEQVFRHLAGAGVAAFFSRESLPELGNADYRREIDRALDEADHMVVVTSAVEHVLSPWVEAEWGFFINEKRSGRKTGNIVTVLVGGLGPAKLPPSLRNYEAIPFERAFDRLASYLGFRERPAAAAPAATPARAQEPRQLASFGGAPEITTACVSPAAKLIVTGAGDGSLRFYDTGTRDRRAVLGSPKYWTAGADSAVATLVVSPDGRFVASGHRDGAVRVWRLDDHAAAGEMSQGSAISAMTFSPDSGTLVTGTRDGVIRFWHVEGPDDGRALTGATSRPAPVVHLAYLPKSQWLVSGLVNTATGRHALQIDKTTRPDRTLAYLNLAAPFHHLAIAPDESRLAAVGRDGVIRVYDLAAATGAIAQKQNPRQLTPLVQIDETAGTECSCLAFLTFASAPAIAAGTGASIGVWDARTGRRIARVGVAVVERFVGVADLEPGCLMGAYADGRIGLWQIDDAEPGDVAPPPPARDAHHKLTGRSG